MRHRDIGYIETYRDRETEKTQKNTHIYRQPEKGRG